MPPINYFRNFFYLFLHFVFGIQNISVYLLNDMTNKQNTMTIKTSNLKGSDYMQMLTTDEMYHYSIELIDKNKDFNDLINKEFLSFKRFVMGSFHWGSSVKGFGYWNRVSIKLDK